MKRIIRKVIAAIIWSAFPATMAATSPDSLRIRVYDAATNGPVEFCNIIAKNVATGALADEWGTGNPAGRPKDAARHADGLMCGI